MDENKNTAIERLLWLILKRPVQTASLFARVKKSVHPAVVGSLAPVFEKSAIELKLNQNKSLKCKSTIEIATFNVRTLNWIGQLPELTAYAMDHNIGITCIQEHRYIHSEAIKYHDTGNGLTLVFVNATIGGEGMLTGPLTLRSQKSIEKIQLRMIVATFKGNPSVTIVSYYNPTNVSKETDPIALYNELSSLVHSIPKHNVLIIGRDKNAEIGKK